MNWDQAFKLAASMLASVGGGAVIIFALSSWLSKVWANRILEADKVKYQSALEVVKRYSESQFHLYNDLWSSLCDLRIAGDSLWEEANSINARRFAQQLQKTRDMVQKRSLLIEGAHYEALKKLMEEFGDFNLGKARLLELRRNQFPLQDLADHDVNRVIQENRLKKEAYSKLLTQLERSLKDQLRNPTTYGV
jgi:Glu-tRNA(Gln) amidotransferase subunit E-like FAD-binding protein